MDIKIIPSTEEHTQSFEEKEWTDVDLEHWGREIEWDLFDYRFSAISNEEIVGIIFGKYEAGTTYVDNLLIGKNYRGKGIGTKLMNFIEEWTKQKGGHKVWLLTHKKWKANKLYQKLGYEQTCTLKKHFLEEDFFLYEKYL